MTSYDLWKDASNWQKLDLANSKNRQPAKFRAASYAPKLTTLAKASFAQDEANNTALFLCRTVAVKRFLTSRTPCACYIFTVTVALSGIRWLPTGYDDTGEQRLFKET